MPTTPNYAIPYPTASDPVSQGAAAMQAMAVPIDTELKKPKWLHGSVNPDGTKGNGSGFTTAKTATGVYTVTATGVNAALWPIAILVTAFATLGNVRVATVCETNPGYFKYFLRDIGTSGGNAVDATAFFLAVFE